MLRRSILKILILLSTGYAVIRVDVYDLFAALRGMDKVGKRGRTCFHTVPASCASFVVDLYDIIFLLFHFNTPWYAVSRILREYRQYCRFHDAFVKYISIISCLRCKFNTFTWIERISQIYHELLVHNYHIICESSKK